MTLVQLLPWVSGLAFAAALVALALRDPAAPPIRGIWRLPALLCLLFLLWSLATVAMEGPFGFWTEHTRNMWGNQIWFDLLLAGSCAWALILPRARAVGMNPFPWLVLILASGCIGFLAMFARLLLLEERRARPAGA